MKTKRAATMMKKRVLFRGILLGALALLCLWGGILGRAAASPNSDAPVSVTTPGCPEQQAQVLWSD